MEQKITKNKLGLLVVILVLGASIVLSGCLGLGDETISADAVKSPTVPSTPSPSAPTIDDDSVKGDPSAPVTIIEFSDYECPFCARFYSGALQQIETEYIDTGKVKMVFRDFPLSFHENAQKAAEAAELAGEQGKYWEMHDKLFDTGKLDIASLKQHAEDIGLDMAKFEAGLDSGEMAAEVQKDMNDGIAAGVSGTPAFFVNGKILVGAQPFSVFKAAIEEALTSASADGETVTGDAVADDAATADDTDDGDATGNTFSVPTSDISSTANFYEYDADGTVVKFFAVKASDGSIRTAFDACDVCGYTKKGYKQDGTDMVCNNCGNRYPIDGLGTENKAGGGCWPGYLPSKVVGDELVIQNSDLAAGTGQF